VNIWYDVTDIAVWGLPHLTGIQRATVGILNGLAARNVECRLVRFDAQYGGFVPVKFAALPELIRRHLHASVTAADTLTPGADSALEAAAVPENGGGGPRSADGSAGAAPPREDPRLAFPSFKAAARDLRRQANRWVKMRFGKAASAECSPVTSAAGYPTGATVPQLKPPRVASAEFAAGDVLLSLGASWIHGGHAEAAAGLRTRGVRVARMIYDLIPTLKPQWLAPEHTRPITRWARRLLTESDHVFTISQFSRREIERYCSECGFSMPRLSVVRLGDVMQASQRPGEQPPLPRFVPTRPFFICVSTLDVRKNHRLLYDAWSLLAARGQDVCPDLLCIGTPHLYVADLLREIREDWLVNGRIHVLQGIDDRELAWYYGNCLATIYPSRYEGWGLPVAESLGQGRICLASNATSIPEISPDLPEFFEPHDPRRLAALVDRVIQDPAWRREREETIRRSFRPTAWTDTATQILQAIGADADGACRAA